MKDYFFLGKRTFRDGDCGLSYGIADSWTDDAMIEDRHQYLMRQL
jgi:hypothetical protein